jgi:Na+-driven multidrug efflux pump
VLQCCVVSKTGQGDQGLSEKGWPLQKLTYRGIALLYLPLAASWALMLMEAPLVNAFLARGADPELSLAAFGVAFNIILVVEAPVLMILELSIALSRNIAAFHRIRRFYVLIGLAVTTLGLLLFHTPLCRVLLRDLMHIPPAIADATVPALRMFVWWPFPIGWRRLYQGVLVNDGRTRIISIATAIRLLVLVAVLAVGQAVGTIPGAILGATTMLLAVVVETTIIHGAATLTSQRSLSRKPAGTEPTSLRYLWSFYLPLAITGVLRQLIRPLTSAGIAAAPMAELSLAAWPVAFSLASVFWGPTMGLQRVAVALTSDKDSWHTVSRFVLAVGLLLTLALAFISFTPLLWVVLCNLFGLSEVIAALAAPAVRIQVLLPLAYTFHALYTGVLVKQGRTVTVRTAKIVDAGVVGLTLYGGLVYGGLWGAVLGAVAVTSGSLAEAAWLYWRSRPAIEVVAGLSHVDSST